jgi:hypothetical protein
MKHKKTPAKLPVSITKKMVRPRGMFTSFYQAQKIAVTLLYKFKTVDLSCFYTEEKILSKWQKTAI